MTVVVLGTGGLILLGVVAGLSWWLASTSAWPWIPGVLTVLGIFCIRDVVRRSGEDRIESLIVLGLVVAVAVTWWAAGTRKYDQRKRVSRGSALPVHVVRLPHPRNGDWSGTFAQLRGVIAPGLVLHETHEPADLRLPRSTRVRHG